MMLDESPLLVVLDLIADLCFFCVLLLCLAVLRILGCSGVCCWVARLKCGDQHRKLGMEGRRGVGGDQAPVVTGKTAYRPRGPVGM